MRCGSPVLDIKNWIKGSGCFDTKISAFTQDAKYYLDLCTICDGPVICDREEYLSDAFDREAYDYVVCDKDINLYRDPEMLLKNIFSFCKKDGIVVIKLKNTESFYEFFNALGYRDVYDEEIAYNITIEALQKKVGEYGRVCRLFHIPYDGQPVSDEDINKHLPEVYGSKKRKEVINRLRSREFLVVINKF